MPAHRVSFWRSREAVWRALAEKLGAEYIDAGAWKQDRVLVGHEEWTIVLDSTFNAGSKSSFTRMRAPYVNPDGFRFTIYRRGLFSEVATFLGMQDVEVGHAAFDRQFVIKGTDDGKLRSLFDSPRIRRLLAAQSGIRLTVDDDVQTFEPAIVAADTDELCAIVPGVLTDVRRLRLLFDLFAETLDQLCLIGSAYETAPEPGRCPYCGHLLVSQSVCPECGKPVTAHSDGCFPADC